MTATLYGMGYSPWTERARWALDHHGVGYAYREHVPMLGEIALRMKARTTKVSVPLLVDGEKVVIGSGGIGRYAEGAGRGERLFPSDHDAEIARWIERADAMLDGGRAWVISRILERPDAQAESLPPFIPAPLRRTLAPTAGMGSRFLAKKYGVGTDVAAQIEKTVRPVLNEIRAVVASRPYLLVSGFSFADVAIAAALQVVRPHADAKVGPHNRAAWENEALAAEFGDLLEWRDAIYAKHRGQQRGRA